LDGHGKGYGTENAEGEVAIQPPFPNKFITPQRLVLDAANTVTNRGGCRPRKAITKTTKSIPELKSKFN
jgi:hypothetical protein